MKSIVIGFEQFLTYKTLFIPSVPSTPPSHPTSLSLHLSLFLLLSLSLFPSFCPPHMTRWRIKAPVIPGDMVGTGRP